MNLVYTVLIAFPLGFALRDRTIALLSYLLAGSYLFSFQSTGVLLDWLGHNGRSAFGPSPTGFPAESSTSEVFGYGVVNLVITVIGIGLVFLGHWVRARRVARKDVVSVA